MKSSQVTTSYDAKELCLVTPPSEINEFCKEFGLERALRSYINLVCKIFKDASEITLYLSEDPEIENYIRVYFNIKIKTDVQSLLQMDKEFFKAIESGISDNEKNFFVKTYDIIE